MVCEVDVSTNKISILNVTATIVMPFLQWLKYCFPKGVHSSETEITRYGKL